MVGATSPDPKSNLGRYRQLAPSAAVRVSPLCLGAMTFGGREEQRYGECSKETAFAILDEFYQAGGNFIDTANSYQQGQSEVWVGEWMASRNVRDETVLATKYTTGYMGHHKNSIQANYGGNGTKSMKLSLEASLKKLQTSYIDLFYLHWWDFGVTIEELMQSLNDLVRSGKVHYLGISDAPAYIVTKANEYARCHGLRGFSVYQGMWNASLRDFERDIIPMCQLEGMALCPYGVLNQGRFQTAEGFKAREKNPEGRQAVPLNERDKQVSAHLEKIANKKGGVSLFNVALAYVLQKAPYVFPIVGGRKVEHIKGSIDALSVSLTDEEVREVETGYEFDYGFPHTFLSGSLIFGTKPANATKPDDVFLTKPLGPFDWVEQPKAIKLGK